MRGNEFDRSSNQRGHLLRGVMNKARKLADVHGLRLSRGQLTMTPFKEDSYIARRLMRRITEASK